MIACTPALLLGVSNLGDFIAMSGQVTCRTHPRARFARLTMTLLPNRHDLHNVAELVDLDLSQDLPVSAQEELIYVSHAGVVYETPSERRRMQSAGMKIQSRSRVDRCSLLSKYAATPPQRRRIQSGRARPQPRPQSRTPHPPLAVLSLCARCRTPSISGERGVDLKLCLVPPHSACSKGA